MIMRVYRDGGNAYSLWFELEPDLFWCGDDLEDAKDCQRRVPLSGATEESLLDAYPHGSWKE